MRGFGPHFRFSSGALPPFVRASVECPATCNRGGFPARGFPPAAAQYLSFSCRLQNQVGLKPLAKRALRGAVASERLHAAARSSQSARWIAQTKPHSSRAIATIATFFDLPRLISAR